MRQENDSSQPAEDKQTIPVVIYVGEERRIVGEAVLVADERGIKAYIEHTKGSDILTRAAREGVLTSLSVTLNPKPAIPVLENGHIRWVKDY